jgi:hypothetical protein
VDRKHFQIRPGQVSEIMARREKGLMGLCEGSGARPTRNQCSHQLNTAVMRKEARGQEGRVVEHTFS